jgi:hypothetical protein
MAEREEGKRDRAGREIEGEERYNRKTETESQRQRLTKRQKEKHIQQIDRDRDIE